MAQNEILEYYWLDSLLWTYRMVDAAIAEQIGWPPLDCRLRVHRLEGTFDEVTSFSEETDWGSGTILTYVNTPERFREYWRQLRNRATLPAPPKSSQPGVWWTSPGAGGWWTYGRQWTWWEVAPAPSEPKWEGTWPSGYTHNTIPQLIFAGGPLASLRQQESAGCGLYHNVAYSGTRQNSQTPPPVVLRVTVDNTNSDLEASVPVSVSISLTSASPVSVTNEEGVTQLWSRRTAYASAEDDAFTLYGWEYLEDEKTYYKPGWGPPTDSLAETIAHTGGATTFSFSTTVTIPPRTRRGVYVKLFYTYGVGADGFSGFDTSPAVGTISLTVRCGDIEDSIIAPNHWP